MMFFKILAFLAVSTILGALAFAGVLELAKMFGYFPTVLSGGFAGLFIGLRACGYFGGR